MKISLIIPIFNSANFLEQCLNSIFPQLNSQDELLLVDNGSTDASLKIATKFADRSPNIHIFSCSTPGASACRNLALKNARGDYIWYIDSDDYIAADALTKIRTVLKSRPDFLMLGVTKFFENGAAAYLKPVPNAKGWQHQFVRFGCGPCQCVFKRTYAFDHQLFFKEGIINEDTALMPTFALFTEKFVSLDQPLYFYRQHDGSVTFRTTWDDHILDMFTALEIIIARFKSENAFRKYYLDLEYLAIWNLLLDSARDFARFKAGQPAFKKARQFFATNFPNWRKNPYFRQKSLKFRLKCLLNFYGIHKPAQK